MRIRQVGTELFHADRRTDITTLIVALHNIAARLTTSTRTTTAFTRVCVCVCVFV